MMTFHNLKFDIYKFIAKYSLIKNILKDPKKKEKKKLTSLNDRSWSFWRNIIVAIVTADHQYVRLT